MLLPEGSMTMMQTIKSFHMTKQYISIQIMLLKRHLHIGFLTSSTSSMKKGSSDISLLRLQQNLKNNH